jgi:uncharacterized membrane protein (DUF485 family)
MYVVCSIYMYTLYIVIYIHVSYNELFLDSQFASHAQVTVTIVQLISHSFRSKPLTVCAYRMRWQL